LRRNSAPLNGPMNGTFLLLAIGTVAIVVGVPTAPISAKVSQPQAPWSLSDQTLGNYVTLQDRKWLTANRLCVQEVRL
jgi:hypothetical protein